MQFPESLLKAFLSGGAVPGCCPKVFETNGIASSLDMRELIGCCVHRFRLEFCPGTSLFPVMLDCTIRFEELVILKDSPVNGTSATVRLPMSDRRGNAEATRRTAGCAVTLKPTVCWGDFHDQRSPSPSPAYWRLFALAKASGCRSRSHQMPAAFIFSPRSTR